MTSGMVTLRIHPERDKKDLLRRYVLYGGFDVGRHVHPSHLALFLPSTHGIYYQVASVWMDNEPYQNQIGTIMGVVEKVPCARACVLYDNTRGELVALDETGALPPFMVPVSITAQNKRVMAGRLLTMLDDKKIVLLDDRRQTESLLAVNMLLQASESEQGHGEAFTSLMLAVEGITGSASSILRTLGNRSAL